MAILRADYENITVECKHCGGDVVYNRATDLQETSPMSGMHVSCLNCDERLWISGDVANPAFELFIFDANQHFAQKRYMLCVSLLAQAWEVFFATYLNLKFAYGPFFRSV